jgi:Spy/CpxP family protein refolding chaperone
VRAHLAVAASALLQAAAGVLAAAAASPGPSPERDHTGVERIDLDGDLDGHTDGHHDGAWPEDDE